MGASSSCHPTHPALLNEEVLEVMFSKLPFQELKKCRLVCRKWEESSRTLMKAQSQLRLTGNIRRNLALGGFLRRDFHFFVPSKLNIDISTYPELNKLIDWWASEISQEVRNKISDYIERLYKGLEGIYGILGKHSFQELQIYKADFHGISTPTTSGRLLNILTPLSTTLKSLQICFNDFSKTPTEQQTLDICPLLTKISIGYAPMWIHERILSVCPNLMEISTKQYDQRQKPAILEKTSGRLTKLLGFTCSTQEDLEIMSRKSGNLEELSLEHLEVSSIGRAILEFVQSKRESLTFLELKFWKIPETLRLGKGFSELTKVHLQMMNCYPCAESCLLEICFWRETPQLKYFELKVFGDRQRQQWKDLLAYKRNITNEGRAIPLRTLTHLDLYVGGRVDRECANYLRQLFPSLTSFKIKRPTHDFLRGLWEMESLVELHMDLWPNDNNQDIGDVGAALFGTPQDEELEENILNLKELRYLSIYNMRRWNSGGNRIPEETVRNGFGNMRSLAVLKLRQFYMTSKDIGFLKAHLPYLKELKSDAHLYRK